MTKKKIEANVSTDTTATTTTAAASAPTTTASQPLSARVPMAIKYLKMAMAVLALNPPALTAAQRKGMNKLPKGGEKQIPVVAQIASKLGVTLRTQPTDAMTAATEVATELQPFVTLLTACLQEVGDTSFQAESDAWSTASALYAILKRMSHKDPSLKKQLEPVSEFFSFRRRAKKAAAGETAAASKAADAETPAAAATPAKAEATPTTQA